MKHLFLSFFALCLLGTPMHAKVCGTEASVEARDLAAQKMIENHPNYLVVYAKGLVCSSCGIGIRILTSKLDGVDKSLFNKGIDLDAKTQLLLVAFKSVADVDVDGVRKAIYRAGYDPAHYYLWTEANGVTQTAYPASEDESL